MESESSESLQQEGLVTYRKGISKQTINKLKINKDLNFYDLKLQDSWLQRQLSQSYVQLFNKIEQLKCKSFTISFNSYEGSQKILRSISTPIYSHLILLQINKCPIRNIQFLTFMFTPSLNLQITETEVSNFKPLNKILWEKPSKRLIKFSLWLQNNKNPQLSLNRMNKSYYLVLSSLNLNSDLQMISKFDLFDKSCVTFDFNFTTGRIKDNERVLDTIRKNKFSRFLLLDR